MGNGIPVETPIIPAQAGIQSMLARPSVLWDVLFPERTCGNWRLRLSGSFRVDDKRREPAGPVRTTAARQRHSPPRPPAGSRTAPTITGEILDPARRLRAVRNYC